MANSDKTQSLASIIDRLLDIQKELEVLSGVSSQSQDSTENMSLDEWLDTIYDSDEIPSEEQDTQPCVDKIVSDNQLLPASASVMTRLDEYVYGQNAAKKAAIVMYEYLRRGKCRNTLFMGPSGCGKTEIFRQMKEIYPHIVFCDASAITQSGWKGEEKVTDVFRRMLESGMTKEQVEHSIIVYDEFDKLITPATSLYGENVSAAIQGEMLRVIEGAEVPIKYYTNRVHTTTIDTSSIGFAFCGAFTSLYQKKHANKQPAGFGQSNQNTDGPITIEDLIDFGMTPEMAGRISKIVLLDPIEAPELLDMLRADHAYNPIHRIEHEYQVTFDIPDHYLKMLADNTGEQGLGARFLYSKLLEYIDELYLYNSCHNVENDHIKINADGSIAAFSIDSSSRSRRNAAIAPSSVQDAIHSILEAPVTREIALE